MLKNCPVQRATEEIPIVKGLPCHSAIFLQYLISPPTGCRATKFYLSMDCSEWRPPFPIPLTARCGFVMTFWVIGSEGKRCAHFWGLGHAVFLLAACWTVDVRAGFRAAQTLPIPALKPS